MLDDFLYEGVTFDDGRGQFPERLKAPVPRGTRVQVKRKAEELGISAGELVRRAVSSYLQGAGHANAA